MPQPLRTPNNPNVSPVILAALRQIIPAGTNLCNANPADTTGVSQVYIRSRYAMSQGAFPAANLSTLPQEYRRTSARAYAGLLVVSISYYNRWAENNAQTQDQIIQSMEDDLNRIQANLESNEDLVVAGIPHATSIPRFTMSADKGEIDSTFPGMQLLYRTLTAYVNVLEYLV